MAAEKTAGRRRRRKKSVREETPIENAVVETKGRATPSRRKSDKDAGIALFRPIRRFVGYLQDVKAEVDKVTWPTRPEVFRLTRIVALATIASALALGILSFILSIITRDYFMVMVGITLAAVPVTIWAFRRNRVSSGY